MFIKDDLPFINMHEKIKASEPAFYDEPDIKHQLCEILRYHRLGEVPSQEEKTIIYSFDEV